MTKTPFNQPEEELVVPLWVRIGGIILLIAAVCFELLLWIEH